MKRHLADQRAVVRKICLVFPGLTALKASSQTMMKNLLDLISVVATVHLKTQSGKQKCRRSKQNDFRVYSAEPPGFRIPFQIMFFRFLNAGDGKIQRRDNLISEMRE